MDKKALTHIVDDVKHIVVSGLAITLSFDKKVGAMARPLRLEFPGAI